MSENKKKTARHTLKILQWRAAPFSLNYTQLFVIPTKEGSAGFDDWTI
jgi:hypothetical protein